MCAAGEGRDKRLAEIEKCEADVQHLLQQATAVPLALVNTSYLLTSLNGIVHSISVLRLLLQQVCMAL